MKAVGVIAQIFFLCLFLVEAGCEPVAVELAPPPNSGSNQLSVYSWYSPAKIDILPLTEFISTGEAEKASKIKVYVSLLDSFDCQMKTPGAFRFELYNFVQRSGEPKGRRIIIWPDIDLADAVENNNYWRDYLRSYEFNLDFEPQSNQSYILQVTFLRPSGKRLSAEFALKHTN